MKVFIVVSWGGHLKCGCHLEIARSLRERIDELSVDVFVVFPNEKQTSWWSEKDGIYRSMDMTSKIVKENPDVILHGNYLTDLLQRLSDTHFPSSRIIDVTKHHDLRIEDIYQIGFDKQATERVINFLSNLQEVALEAEAAA